MGRNVVGRRRKPGFIETCDPTLMPKPPTGAGWAHEIKWDGYRAQAHLNAGDVEIFTRAGNDWTVTFHPISGAIAGLKASSAIIDGEIVAMKDGLADFHELRHQLGEAVPAIVYQAFDLLWLDGEDLRPLPYVERKERLAGLIPKASKRLFYVEHFEEPGARMLKGACGLHLEGIVSKRLDAPYRSGRSHDWLKTKCEVTETLAVIGFAPDDRGEVEGLILGRREEGGLVYAGSVDRDISRADMTELRRRLPRLVVKKPPLPKPPRKTGARWVEPTELVEVSYPNKSADGRLRHPAFKGLRDDIAKR
jgi:bifunctional non-homologous end joining protein LigD